MLGILLIAFGGIFAEVGVSIGKYEVFKKKESIYSLGFLNAFWATIFLITIGLWRENFIFSAESLPTFLTRMLLEGILLFVSLYAVLKADRSTFAFLRLITLPLLFLVDIYLGYSISLHQIIGAGLIIAALVILLLNHGLSRRGKAITILSAIMAVATVSLYKYDITNFNSVEAEQTIINIVLLMELIIVGRIMGRENVFNSLRKPLLLFQSLCTGIGAVSINFAYLFAPASIIMTAERAVQILASIISGRSYFHEKHILVKISAFLIIVTGIGLMVV